MKTATMTAATMTIETKATAPAAAWQECCIEGGGSTAMGTYNNHQLTKRSSGNGNGNGNDDSNDEGHIQQSTMNGNNGSNDNDDGNKGNGAGGSLARARRWRLWQRGNSNGGGIYNNQQLTKRSGGNGNRNDEDDCVNDDDGNKGNGGGGSLARARRWRWQRGGSAVAAQQQRKAAVGQRSKDALEDTLEGQAGEGVWRSSSSWDVKFLVEFCKPLAGWSVYTVRAYVHTCNTL
jgi:hypothetical protein